jgi:hypothetical protein
MYGNHYLEFRRFPGKNDYFFVTFDPMWDLKAQDIA